MSGLWIGGISTIDGAHDEYLRSNRGKGCRRIYTQLQQACKGIYCICKCKTADEHHGKPVQSKRKI